MKITIQEKTTSYGSVKISKYKIILGESVIGEVPTLDMAIKRATAQAKSSKINKVEIIHGNGKTEELVI